MNPSTKNQTNKKTLFSRAFFYWRRWADSASRVLKTIQRDCFCLVNSARPFRILQLEIKPIKKTLFSRAFFYWRRWADSASRVLKTIQRDCFCLVNSARPFRILQLEIKPIKKHSFQEHFFIGGVGRIRTAESEFCRLVPYHLATTPDIKKLRYYSLFTSIKNSTN